MFFLLKYDQPLWVVLHVKIVFSAFLQVSAAKSYVLLFKTVAAKNRFLAFVVFFLLLPKNVVFFTIDPGSYF